VKLSETLARLRYGLFPDHVIGEVLSKRWTDNAIPLLFLLATVIGIGTAIPDFFSLASLADASRQLGEFAIVVMGLTIVMLGGGIDLSVGATFALSAFASVAVIYILGGPIWLALLAALATGAVVGAANGLLIGYLRLRAFLTTLVTFTILHAIYSILRPRSGNSSVTGAWRVSPSA
jgi:ribose transport system permease protein